MKGGVYMAVLTTLISGITAASVFIFGLFTDFIDMIATNDILLYLVLFSMVAGSVGLVISLIKRFGLKGRRR